MVDVEFEDIKKFKLQLKKKNIIVDKNFFKRFFSSKKVRSCVLSANDYDLISKMAETSASRTTISKADLLDDIHFLEKIFPFCYGGYSVFERRGLNWVRVFRNWRKDIEKMPVQFEIKEAILPFEKSFEHFIDNHLQFVFIKKRQKKTSISIIGNKKEAGFSIHTKTVFRDNELERLPVSVGPIHRLNKPFDKLTQDIHFHNKNIDSFHPHNKIGVLSTKAYCYLRIPTFTSDVSSGLKNVKVDNKRDFFGPLIIDLRSNKGLSNIKVVNLINRLACVEGTPNFLAYFDTRIKRNRYTDTLADNFDLFFLLQSKTDKSKLDLRKTIKENSKKRPVKKSKKIIKNARPVVIIINRFVSSDGEAILKYLMNFKNKVVIGENTGGCCEFVEPGLLVLPKTKLPLLVPRGYNRFKNEDYIGLDGYGFAPDIYLDDDKWSKKEILKFIQKVFDPLMYKRHSYYVNK